MGRLEEANASSFILTNLLLAFINQTTTSQQALRRQILTGTITFSPSPECNDTIYNHQNCPFPNVHSSSVSLYRQKQAMEQSWRESRAYQINVPQERTSDSENQCRAFVGQRTTCQLHDGHYRCHVTQQCRKALTMVAFWTYGTSEHHVAFKNIPLNERGAGPKTYISVGEANANVQDFTLECYDVHHGVRQNTDCAFQGDIVVYTLEYRCTACTMS